MFVSDLLVGCIFSCQLVFLIIACRREAYISCQVVVSYFWKIFSLTHLMPLVYFHTSWKLLVLFSGGRERSQWHEMGYGDWKTLQWQQNNFNLFLVYTLLDLSRIITCVSSPKIDREPLEMHVQCWFVEHIDLRTGGFQRNRRNCCSIREQKQPFLTVAKSVQRGMHLLAFNEFTHFKTSISVPPGNIKNLQIF